MELISFNASIMLNLFNGWKNNKEKNIIIDPMSCLIKLGLLTFYPVGTKISIADNKITLSEPSILQGTFRFLNGDGREDLHNLCAPIMKSIEWYWNPEDKEMGALFDYAITGLEKLRNTYPTNSIISHCLDLYAQYLVCKKVKKLEDISIVKKKKAVTAAEVEDDNKIHNFLKTMWSPREIHIIIQTLLEYDAKLKTNKQETDKLHSILEMTSAKERELLTFLKGHSTSL
jgi:hypothetical protein